MNEEFTQGAPRSAVSYRPCDHCGNAVDPLRAVRVAMFYDKFRYFCSATCREFFDPEAGRVALPVSRRLSALRREDVIATEENTLADLSARQKTAEALSSIVDADLGLDGLGGSEGSVGHYEELTRQDQLVMAEVVEPTDLPALLLALAAISGVLSLLLGLAGDSTLLLFIRAVILVVGSVALLSRSFAGARDATEAHPAALVSVPLIAALATLLCTLLKLPDQLSQLASVCLIASSVGIWLMQRARQPIEAEREHIQTALEAATQRVVGQELSPATAFDLRPGEEILIEAGQTVPADITIIAGSAQVEPWLNSELRQTRGEGDSLVAGSKVLSGRIRAVVAWAGLDRAWVRLTNDPRRRVELLAPSSRLGRILAERAAPAFALVAGLSALAAGGSWLLVLAYALAAHTAVATAGVAQIGALHFGLGLLASLRRGIAYRSALAFERAGMATLAAFCARGTLLLGEPEVASVEVLGSESPERILSLLAGAEVGSTHPVAVAVLRAARARGVRPDGVRSITQLAGLGVTGVTSSGQPLAVGNRALMLQERISVGSVEARLTELEAMGRTALLVAVGERVEGLVGLQDGLRPGARAAVQYLLDARVEPVLLSGDARETCDALGRSLDIDHIRPEILPAERGNEVRRLADAGASVVVFGLSPADDVALAAADVSVALASAGSISAEWDVQLASDSIRDAAYGVAVAGRARREARLGLVLALAPGCFAALAMGIGVLSPVWVVVCGFVGTALALTRARLLAV